MTTSIRVRHIKVNVHLNTKRRKMRISQKSLNISDILAIYAMLNVIYKNRIRQDLTFFLSSSRLHLGRKDKFL